MKPLALLALTVALASSGCVTAMGQKGIDRLTTCEGADWATIRQSLVKNGYELRKDTDAVLETEFKEVDDYGSDRRLRRITVTKADDGTIRFQERIKTIRRDDSLLMGGMGGVGGGRRSGVTVGIQVGDPLEIENEFEQEYYEERRSEYEAVQREVCGVNP